MFHDGDVTFIFYSLLNLIVYLMFSTKINPFQNWLFQERIFICFISYVLYVSWRRRNVHILFSSKSDRFAYVSNQNKAVSKLIISRTHIYMFDMFHDGDVMFIFYSLLNRFSYVSNKNKAVSKVIISRTHINIFHMFYMFHDGVVTFIFYSLLNLIVFLMFPTKIRVSRVIISGTHM